MHGRERDPFYWRREWGENSLKEREWNDLFSDCIIDKTTAMILLLCIEREGERAANCVLTGYEVERRDDNILIRVNVIWGNIELCNWVWDQRWFINSCFHVIDTVHGILFKNHKERLATIITNYLPGIFLHIVHCRCCNLRPLHSLDFGSRRWERGKFNKYQLRACNIKSNQDLCIRTNEIGFTILTFISLQGI